MWPRSCPSVSISSWAHTAGGICTLPPPGTRMTSANYDTRPSVSDCTFFHTQSCGSATPRTSLHRRSLHRRSQPPSLQPCMVISRQLARSLRPRRNATHAMSECCAGGMYWGYRAHDMGPTCRQLTLHSCRHLTEHSCWLHNCRWTYVIGSYTMCNPAPQPFTWA